MSAWILILVVPLICGAWQWPKLFLFCSLIALLAGRTLEAISPVDAVKYIDESVVLIAVLLFPIRRILLGRRLRRLPGMRWFLAFSVMGLTSALIAEVPVATFSTGAFLMMKGPLFAWAVCQLDWKASDIQKLCRWSVGLLVFIFTCTLANVAVPQLWLNWLLEESTFASDSRFGLPIIVGPFAHPGYFSTLMAMSTLAILSYRHHIHRSGLTAILLFASVASIIAGFRRKTLLTLPLSLAGYARLARSRWLPVIFFPGLAVIVINFWSFLSNALQETTREYLSDPDRVARIRLTLDAPTVAANAFPFGAGFGRFASGAARQNYSPIYQDLGYQHVWGLGPTEENGRFLTDTFWPAIIGETGFFGTAFYICGLVTIALAAKKYSYSPDAWNKWLSMTAVLWSLHLALESLIEPVYSSTPVFGVFFGLIGVLTGYQVHSSRSEERITSTARKVNHNEPISDSRGPGS